MTMVQILAPEKRDDIRSERKSDAVPKIIAVGKHHPVERAPDEGGNNYGDDTW